ncbi:MAG: hypothetical protein AB9897_03335 [Anaerolineaceae bacterium]
MFARDAAIKVFIKIDCVTFGESSSIGALSGTGETRRWIDTLTSAERTEYYVLVKVPTGNEVSWLTDLRMEGGFF